jgi:hypothetical protein
MKEGSGVVREQTDVPLDDVDFRAMFTVQSEVGRGCWGNSSTNEVASVRLTLGICVKSLA